LGTTLSLRKIQSWASLGNLAPLLRVMMVSSISKEATFSEGLRPGDDPMKQLPCCFHAHVAPLSVSSYFVLAALGLGGI